MDPKEATPAYIPPQEQIEAFSRLLLPEIQKFFADEEVQRDFAEWQAAHLSDTA